MTISPLCPCCHSKLIHHIGHHRDYWFCRNCWSEMPIIDDKDNVRETKRNFDASEKVLNYSRSSN